MLGEHLEVNRAHFSEIEGDEFIVRASYANGLEPFRGRGPVSMFGRALVESFRRAEPALVNDVDRDPRLTGDERSVLRAAGIAAFAASMLTREGRWAAALAVHSAAPRV